MPNCLVEPTALETEVSLSSASAQEFEQYVIDKRIRLAELKEEQAILEKQLKDVLRTNRNVIKIVL